MQPLAHDAAPGTIAQIGLKVAGLETPSKVTLGAYPNPRLSQPPFNEPRCRQERTLWEVPVLPIKSLDKGGRALVQLAIAPDAAPGPHTLYLVSPGGLSNGLPFWVAPHPGEPGVPGRGATGRCMVMQGYAYTCSHDQGARLPPCR